VSRSHIANTIRLLQLPLDTQQLLTDGRIQAGHARALLALGDADAQNALAVRTAADDLWVREVVELVRGFGAGPTAPKRVAAVPDAEEPPTDTTMAEVEEILSEQLATRVQIQMGKQRGRVIIEFGSADDLERIVSEIVGSGPGLAPD
jgi:ParB family chromosome partitioning protein